MSQRGRGQLVHELAMFRCGRVRLPGGWPSFALHLYRRERGCPSFPSVGKLGTMNACVEGFSGLRSHNFPGKKSPPTVGSNAQLSNPAKAGAASVRMMPAKLGQPPVRHQQSLRGTVGSVGDRSEEHTSELQSRPHLVCRLLL